MMNAIKQNIWLPVFFIVGSISFFGCEYTDEQSVSSELIDPIYMLSHSGELYEQGNKEQALELYYDAQYKYRYISAILNIEKAKQYNTKEFNYINTLSLLNSSLGETMNGYGFCDIENVISVLNKTKEKNKNIDTNVNFTEKLSKKYSVLFVEKEYFAEKNKEISDGIDEFILYLSENKKEIKETREKNGINKEFCL